MNTTVTERVIPVTYDRRGKPVWRSIMKPADGTYGVCYMVPDRVIPIIFVPGIMGSNLIQKGVKDKDEAIKWRMDGAKSAGRWALSDRNAAFRKRYLSPDAMEVDTGGHVPEHLALPAEELRRRAWGEIGAMSYEPFLIWLENALNDFDNVKTGPRIDLMKLALGAEQGEAPLTYDEVALSCRYRFPVHACGYNWLDDNAVSAKRLSDRIDKIRERYANEKQKCDKVIIVTHSMGGLVARHCSEVRNRRGDILGIVHGVMPAIGAAAVYRRFKAGTEDPTAWYNAAGAVASSVLGNDAAEMTAVLSSAPGALQLLPTADYGNGWLKIRDGSKEYTLPENGDPYGDIYTVRGKWWSMCEDRLMNPLNDERNPTKRQNQMNRDWDAYVELIKIVRKFHRAIAERYHPTTHAFFGSHTDNRAYGTVAWTNRWPTGVNNYPSGGQEADVLNGKILATSGNEINKTRTATVPVTGSWRKQEAQIYKISEPDEAGDGTVPHRSGVAPERSCQSFLRVNVGHEPAYKFEEGADNLRACHFTLRAIVKIAQAVQQTNLRYEK
jgi:pimeloyl-ACP methyl ester carboxylesterase